jgi:thioredoxin 1
MSCVTPVDDAEFEAKVLQSAEPVLVDFYTPVCPPCRQVAPILEQLCTDNQGKLKVVKIDADENQTTAVAHNVSAVPTFALYKNGKLVDQVCGAKSRDWFDKWLTTSLAQD